MSKKKKRPSNVQSKEVLIAYLDSNPNELPFNEECWNAALIEAKTRNELIKTANAVPGARMKKLTSPGAVYFELLATPLFKEQTQATIHSQAKLDKDGTSLKEVDIKNLIDNIDEPQGQFIYKFLTQYFGTFHSEDSVKFLIERIKSYYGEYELNAASDEFLVMTAITDELVIREITKRRVLGEIIDNKELETIRNGYMKSLDGLKALKKLDTSDKGKDDKFTVWVNKLLQEGELTQKKETFDEDQIDRLIRFQTDGIRRSYSE